MADETPLLGLPYILPSQAQKHVTHNEGMLRLDTVVQLVVLNRTLTTPPLTAADGDRYIVPMGSILAWQGHEGEIATWRGQVWEFVTPRAGWQARVLSEGVGVVFDGTGWDVPPLDLNNLPGVGINTSADVVNRLAVSAPATLLNHAGAGHQLKINKDTPPDTASLLFQTGFSGRAEMGTSGSDQFSIKVSENGSTWVTALGFDGTTGIADGTAVQQSPTDVTPGRLMRADFGYGPGNLLGPVAELGGVPQGAVMERGSTANGEYTRFADGTQLCYGFLPVGSIVAVGSGTWAAPYRSLPDVTWTFPAAFVGTPVVHGRAIPPVAASVSPDRRRAIVGMGVANAVAVFQIHAIRLGSATTADIFEVGMFAIGRWY